MAAGTFEGLSAALARFGLCLRGGFDFEADEARPAGPWGSPARSVLLVGHAGGSIWPHFSAWLSDREAKPAHPLDAWSAEVINAIAVAFGARAVFPWEKPYQPFQQWGMRAEGLKPSPLGMLIHPRYGLWHAYRGALLLDDEIPIQRAHASIHPCDGCAEKPCLSACPVDAFSLSGSLPGFDVAGCRSYLDSRASRIDSPASQAGSMASRDDSATGPDCMREGCRARDACPVGRDYRYGPAQIRFHMRAFSTASRS